MLKRLAARLVTLLFFASAASAAPQVPEALKKTGVLRVATDPTFPPMETEDAAGQITGFDVELARLIAKHLHLRAEVQAVSWDGIIVGLQSRRYDMVMSAMNITPERQKNALFVEYYRTSQVFVGKPGMKLAKVEDLAGTIVAVQADSTSAYFVEKARANGVAVKDIKEYRNTTDIFAAIRAGHANTMVIDEPVGRYFAKLDPEHFQVMGQSRSPEPLGIALHKDDVALGKAIEAALAEIKASGEMRALTKTWFGI